MFDTYGTINIENKEVQIENLSIEELNKYYNLLKTKENNLIKQQNEYLSQLIG